MGTVDCQRAGTKFQRTPFRQGQITGCIYFNISGNGIASGNGICASGDIHGNFTGIQISIIQIKRTAADIQSAIRCIVGLIAVKINSAVDV